MRPFFRAIDAGAVKCTHAVTERRRISADVVQGNKPVVDIKTGVLHAFSHDRRGQLLKFAREYSSLHGQGRVAGRRLAEQGRLDEIEDAGIDGAAAPARQADGPFYVSPVLRRHLVRNVCAVDRKRDDHFGQCAAQCVEREIARVPVGARDTHQAIGHHRQFACQGVTQD